MADDMPIVVYGSKADLDGIRMIRTAPPTAAEVTQMVDETAKSVMRMQGRDPEVWDRLPETERDLLRIRALDRLRSLA